MLTALLSNLLSGQEYVNPFKYMMIHIINFVHVPSLDTKWTDENGSEQIIEKGILTYRKIDDNGQVLPGIFTESGVAVSALNFQNLPSYNGAHAMVTLLPYDLGNDWRAESVAKKLRDLAAEANVDSIANDGTEYSFTEKRNGKENIIILTGTDIHAKVTAQVNRVSKGDRWRKVNIDIDTNKAAAMQYAISIGNIETAMRVK
jgi:hypothetical protein